MPIISESALSRLMNAVNEGDSTFAKALQQSTDEFADELSKIWESKKAHEFSQKVEDAVKEAYESYKKLVQNTYNSLETNVKNHNMFNNANVALAGLALTSPAIAIATKIKEFFADGSGDEMGIKKGRKATEATEALGKLSSQIATAISNVSSGIIGSGAFDEEETRAVGKAFQNIFDKLDETFNQLKQEANSALGTVDSDAAKLSSTNISNMGGN